MKILSKKAGVTPRAILLLPKFAMLILFLVFLTILILNFYSKQFDIREVEASLITRETLECYDQHGFDEEKIFGCLGLSDSGDGDFFLRITLEKEEEKQEIKIGRDFIASLCGIKEGNVPSCFTEYFILNENEELEVFVVILKLDENV